MSERAALALGTAIAGGFGVGSAVGVGLLSARVDKIQTAINAIEAALARLGVQPGQMTGIIETIQANIVTLNSEVAGLMVLVTSLQTMDAQQNRAIANLQAEVTSLSQRVAVLEAELPPGLRHRVS